MNNVCLEIDLNTHREDTTLSNIATVNALIELIVANRELGITTRILSQSKEVAALSPDRDALQP